MAVNRAYNGGFEIGNGAGAFPDGWIRGAGDASTVYSWVSENVYDGVKAIKIVNSTFMANLVSVIQPLGVATAVAEGEKWEAGAWMVTDAPGKGLRVLVDFYDALGGFVHSAHLKFTSTTTLARYAGVVTVPAGAAKAALDVGMHDTGTVWLDAVSFVRLHPVDPVDVGERPERFFYRTVTGVTTGDAFAFLAPVDTSDQALLTFIVKNTGTPNADVKLQISADGSTWLDEGDPRVVAGGATVTLVPATFLKFARLAHRSSVAGQPTTLDVTVQAQIL